MEIEGKVAIVTGSSRGIGMAVAEAIAQEGGKVIINSNSSVEEGCALRDVLIKNGLSAWYEQADVTDPKEVRRLLSKAKTLYGQLDILVNNAGIYLEGLGSITDYHDFISVVTSNGWSVYLGCLLADEFMSDGGRIVNISSLYAVDPSENSIVAGSVKAMVDNYTKAFAKKYMGRFNVNAVGPGYTDTRLLNENVPEKQLRQVLERTSMGRLIEPGEISDMVVSLIRNDAVTGQIVYVEAGHNLHAYVNGK